jgi:hypothetical protein
LLKDGRADRKDSLPLTVLEIVEAEKLWIQQAQQNKYGDIIQNLRKNPTSPSGSLKPLNPFLDSEGILRVGGRLQGSDLPYDAKHPIIIPQKCHLATLIVWKAHSDLGSHTKGWLNCVKSTGYCVAVRKLRRSIGSVLSVPYEKNV